MINTTQEAGSNKKISHVFIKLPILVRVPTEAHLCFSRFNLLKTRDDNPREFMDKKRKIMNRTTKRKAVALSSFNQRAVSHQTNTINIFKQFSLLSVLNY